MNNLLPEQISSAFYEMLERSQTKLVGPAVAYTLVKLCRETGGNEFTTLEIRHRYPRAVCELVRSVGHNLHLGAKFDNAYIARDDRGVASHGFVKRIDNHKYAVVEPFLACVDELDHWIPKVIREYLDRKLGSVVRLREPVDRLACAENPNEFLRLLDERLSADDKGVSFEIVSFSLLKVYLEKFACRIYRDTRTFSHEGGTDLSTDFGAVYQIKKMKLTRKNEVEALYAEIRSNFDRERIQDGRVVIIIDDISPECKTYLLEKNALKFIQRSDLLQIATCLRDVEDRQKVLRIIYEEFCREYDNYICSSRGCDGISCPILAGIEDEDNGK